VVDVATKTTFFFITHFSFCHSFLDSYFKGVGKLKRKCQRIGEAAKSYIDNRTINYAENGQSSISSETKSGSSSSSSSPNRGGLWKKILGRVIPRCQDLDRSRHNGSIQLN